MAPPSSNPRARTRRAEIVAAATDLFARQGFHGVGMRAIADAVGIRSSSLYHHFPSKVDLLKAISLDYMKEYVARSIDELQDTRIPPATRLRQRFRAHVIFFYTHRQEEAVGLVHLRELSQLEPESYREVQEVRRRYQHAVEAVIEEGITRNEFVIEDAHLATFEVLGLVNSVNTWFREDGGTTITALADEYAAVAVDRILGARR